MVISLDKFLKLSESNTVAVKKFLSGCVREAFLKRQDAFRNEPMTGNNTWDGLQWKVKSFAPGPF